MTEEEVMIELT